MIIYNIPRRWYYYLTKQKGETQMRKFKAIQYAPYDETLLDIYLPDGEFRDVFIYFTAAE